jgi:hypothetical protein
VVVFTVAIIEIWKGSGNLLCITHQFQYKSSKNGRTKFVKLYAEIYLMD